METMQMVPVTAAQAMPVPSAYPAERPSRLLPVPWRDPHSVTPTERKSYITFLEQACEANPASADLRTCLGMAYAMDYQVYKSSDALELAIELDGTHFFARMKYAELLYRLRALPKAEEEAKKALDVAGNTWEIGLARKQLQEIRARLHESTRRPEFTKPLLVPTLSLLGLFTVCSALVMLWK
jgi:tetratricopeptide (TPR) repeat protein